MSDRYGYIAIETLLNFCENSKDHAVTPNDFMRMPRVRVPEQKQGKWLKKMRVTKTEKYISYDPDWYCACCGAKYDPHIAKIVNFCYVCGADMRGEQNGVR